MFVLLLVVRCQLHQHINLTDQSFLGFAFWRHKQHSWCFLFSPNRRVARAQWPCESWDLSKLLSSPDNRSQCEGLGRSHELAILELCAVLLPRIWYESGPWYAQAALYITDAAGKFDDKSTICHLPPLEASQTDFNGHQCSCHLGVPNDVVRRN